MKYKLIEEKKTFAYWWDNYGSSIRPQKKEDVEQFAKRIAALAWSKSK